MSRIQLRHFDWNMGFSCIAPLLPLLLLLAVGAMADALRQSAQLSDPILHAMAATVPLDNWTQSLDAESRDYVGRLGWATAIAVFIPLLMVVVAACVATLRRQSMGWWLLLLIPVYWFAERLAVNLESFRPMLSKVGYVAVVLGLSGVAYLAGVTQASEKRCRQLWTAVFLLVGIGIGFWILSGWQLYSWATLQSASEISSRQFAVVAPPFDDLVVRLAQVCPVPGNSSCGRGIYSVDRLVGGSATFVLGLLGLAGAVLIIEPTRSQLRQGAMTDASLESLLSRQRREFQRLLYAAAALLVICVTVAKSLQQWPLSVIHDRSQAKQLQLIADQWLVMLGTYWTLMLAAIFVPVAVALNRRCAALAERNSVPAGAESAAPAAEGRGANLSTYEQCLAVLALLGPWLAGGPLAAFATWMKGGGG